MSYLCLGSLLTPLVYIMYANPIDLKDRKTSRLLYIMNLVVAVMKYESQGLPTLLGLNRLLMAKSVSFTR